MIYLGLAALAIVSLGFFYLHKSLLKQATKRAIEETLGEVQQALQATKNAFDKKISEAQNEVIKQRPARDNLPLDWPADSVIVFETKDSHGASKT